MTATNLVRRTLVVDGNNILSRASFAVRGKNVVLSNHDGVPTAALMVFINLLSKYVRQEAPDNLVVCWDGGRSIERTRLLPEYKGQRPERPDGPDDPERPFAQAKEFLSLAGVHHVEKAGVEADDLVAAYWGAKHSSERMVILSADKDFLQLLDGWTEQIRPGTGLDERWTRNRVRSEMKVLPEDLPKVMALTGDHVDNIPGIPRFGTKTAVKVLSQYQWDLDSAVREHPTLQGLGETVRRNYALVDLRHASVIGRHFAPKFTPTTLTSVMWPDLEQFLLRYDLNSIHDRLVEGTLWSAAGSEVLEGTPSHQ